MIGLTQRQQLILKYISNFMQRHELAPSIAEIAKDLSISSPTVLQHLRALEKKGYIQRSSNARSMRLLNKKTPEKVGAFPVELHTLHTLSQHVASLGKYYLNPIYVVDNYQRVYFALKIEEGVGDFLPFDTLLVRNSTVPQMGAWGVVRSGDLYEVKRVTPEDDIVGEIIMMERAYA